MLIKFALKLIKACNNI